MIIGCTLILLGVLPALANWYSPFSETLTGKHSSMVPPIGGLLIGIGIYCITQSIWWSLLAIAADLGMIVLIVLLPSLISETITYSKFNEVGDFLAFRNGHKTTLKLYRNLTARFTYSTGGTQYSFPATWSKFDNGYEICDYIANRKCILTEKQQHFESVELLDINDARNEIDLNGLIFTCARTMDNQAVNRSRRSRGF
jgi:hypothetical protein